MRKVLWLGLMQIGLLVASGACGSDGSSPAPSPEPPPAAPFTLSRGGFVVSVSRTGDILDLRDRDARTWVRAGLDNRVRVAIDDGGFVSCDAPRSAVQQGDTLTFECDLRPRVPVLVRSTVELVDAAGAVALKRSVQLTPTAPPLRNDVKVSLADNLEPPGSDATLFIPHQDGFGEMAKASGRRFLFALSGRGLDSEGAERLAIPMLSEEAKGHRLTRIADPLFSTSFSLRHSGDAIAKYGWIYTGRDVPLSESETRVFYDVLHQGPPDAAMDAFYATAIEDVPPGPSWLHDIAWQHYDYMSHGGRGWFEDIDALTTALPKEDRGRIMVTLHGWFDVYGHYAFDNGTRRLLDTWTVFPNLAAVAKDFPGLETMPMSKAEVHRRIAYAKERGFRVGFYFADGTATGEDVAGVWSPERVLHEGGWQGPDTTSPTWALNPGHPFVAAYFRDYLDALLGEYGQEIDALVWDETFIVRIGEVGRPEAPSYADRAMMQLTRDLAKRVTAFRRDLALLTSDDIGLPNGGIWTDVPPYAIMAHGTYQDSWSHPDAWRYGLFPNLRNTLWSCNWHPQTNFEYTRIGVERFDTPVATSNGFGDNRGIASLDPPTRDALFALFEKRKAKGRQNLHWLDAR